MSYEDLEAVAQLVESEEETEEHQGRDVYLDVNSKGAWTLKVEVLQ